MRAEAHNPLISYSGEGGGGGTQAGESLYGGVIDGGSLYG